MVQYVDSGGNKDLNFNSGSVAFQIYDGEHITPPSFNFLNYTF